MNASKGVEDVTSSFEAPACSAISFQNLPKVEIKTLAPYVPKGGPWNVSRANMLVGEVYCASA